MGHNSPGFQGTQQSKKSSSIFICTGKTFVDSAMAFIYQYSPRGDICQCILRLYGFILVRSLT